VTIEEVLAVAGAALARAGVTDSPLDAEILLRHVTGWDRATLLAHPGREVAEPDRRRFLSLVETRARRIPLQHLTGVQAFWRQEIHVTPDVLIPRPETEVLVEGAVERLRGRARARVADVGTGSGCIALAVAAEAPDVEVHATDLSRAALAVAEDNARRLGLGDRVTFHEGDLLSPLAAWTGRLDVILSNPPYVDPGDAPDLAPEVRDHEPALALFPPGEPLSIYRRLLPDAVPFLRPGGWILVEVGRGQADAVALLARGAGLVVERVLPDLAGIPRVVEARRAGGSQASGGGSSRATLCP
jgi:release factor glutamine methyltransferase